MVDAKAEGNDEESFGDFMFASFPNHIQISSQKSIMNNDDDDEWGDFVEFPLRSELSSGLSKTQPPSDAAEPSKPFDPFGFFSDDSTTASNSVPTPTESVPSRAESEKSYWVKPKGALPLSIFGDVEQEEEQSGVVDPPVGDKHAENVRNGSNMFVGLALNDIIGNLYNQSQQIKVDTGLDSNSVGSNSNAIGTNPNLNGANSNINGLASNSSGLNSNSEFFSGNNGNQNPRFKTESGLSSNSDLFSGNTPFQNPQSKAVIGLNSNSDLFAGNNGSQSHQIKSVSGLDLNKDLFSGNIGFEAFTSSYSQNQQNSAENSNGSNSSLFTSNSNLSGMDSNINRSITNLDPLGGNKEFDDDDKGWEFKDAYTELKVGDGNGNLYHASQQIRDENGEKSNMIGRNLNSSEVNSDITGSVSNSSGLNSNSDLFAGKSDSQILQSRTESELSLNSDSIYGNSDSQHPQIKAVNGLNSNLDLLAGNNDSQGQQIKAISGLNFFSSGLDSNRDLFPGNIDFDGFSNLYSKSHQNKDLNPNGLNSNENADTSYHGCMDSNFDALVSYSDTPGRNEDFDGDDNGWEFKDAYSNSDTPGRNEDFDGDGDDAVWEFKDAYSESRVGVGNDKVDGKEQGDPEGTGFSSEFANGSHESIDLFSASNRFSGKSTEPGISFDFKPSVTQNGVSTDSIFNSTQHIDSEKRLNSDPVLATVDSDESFGDFESAFTGTESKQENEKISRNHKEALPLSIFCDEELETDDSLKVQDTFTYKPSSHPGNGISSQGSNIPLCSQVSNIPITDLISNLYSQAEQIPSVGIKEKFSGNRLDSSDRVLNCNLVSCDDEIDDTSWEFKDASSQTLVEGQTHPCSPGDAHQNSSTKSKLNNLVDFYCKLKDELSFVCRCHLDSLKKAQNTAALSGEDAKVMVIEEEIQEACKELQEETMNSKESSEDQLPRDICLNEFLEVLQELKFHELESEYHLSRRLHLRRI